MPWNNYVLKAVGFREYFLGPHRLYDFEFIQVFPCALYIIFIFSTCYCNFFRVLTHCFAFLDLPLLSPSVLLLSFPSSFSSLPPSPLCFY